MKTQLTSLAAGALLSAISLTAALAGPAGDAWLADARATLQARVAEAGLADDGKVVAIRIKASESFHDYRPAVARSSGSLDYDAAVTASLRGVRLPAPPIEISGRGVTFTLGAPAAGAANGQP